MTENTLEKESPHEQTIEEPNKPNLYAPRPLWLEFLLTFFTLGLYSYFWFVGRTRDFNQLSAEKKFIPWLWFFVPIITISQFFALPKFVKCFNEICAENNQPQWNQNHYAWILGIILTSIFFTAMEYLEIPDWTLFIALFICSVLMTIAYAKINTFKKNLTNVTFFHPKLKLGIGEWITYIIMIPLCLSMIYLFVIQPLSVKALEELPVNTSYIDPDKQFDLPIKSEGWSIVEPGTYSDDESELELRGPYYDMYFILRKYEISDYSIDSLSEWRMEGYDEYSSKKCNETRTLAASTLTLVARFECTFNSLGSDETILLSYIENDKYIFELYGYFITDKKVTPKYLQNFKDMARGFEPL